jgi:S-DNA-T family DNA segregation ATPase FtsK/SpoIIIE
MIPSIRAQWSSKTGRRERADTNAVSEKGGVEMIALKFLWSSIKGLFRRPHLRKIIELVIVTAVLAAAAHISAWRLTESAIIGFALRWSCVPVSLLFLLIRHGETLRRRFNRFFYERDFEGIDGKSPTFKKKIAVNEYLTKYRFKSRIHLSEWQKIEHKLVMFFKKKIHAIENPGGDVEVTDVSVIENPLPTLIEWRDKYMQAGRVFALGEGYKGRILWDTTVSPHMLLASATNMGKSSIINTVGRQALLKGCDVYITETVKFGSDFMGLVREFENTESVRIELITEPENVLKLLRHLLSESKARMEECSKNDVKKVDELNVIRHENGLPIHQQIMAIFDELAELLDVGKPKDRAQKDMYDEIDQNLRTLARTSRSANISLLCSLIRPSSDIISGSIKNQMMYRVCGFYPDRHASEIMLGDGMAAELPPRTKGRFICKEGNEVDEFRAFYLSS